MNEEKKGSFDRVRALQVKLTDKIRKSSKKFNSEFKKFITKGNVVELAVAMVVGTAFNAIVKGLVDFIITPVTSYIIGSSVDITELKFILREAVAATDTAEEITEISIKYGSFIQTVINFLIISLSVFVTLKVYMKALKVVNRREEAKKRAEEAKKKEEEEKKKAEEAELARIAAERVAQEEEMRRTFYESSIEQAKLLREIRDSLNNKN